MTAAGSFPPRFLWGAATSAYQVEGAATAGGRGESIWDRFCATPGRVRAGETGDVACDFFHRHRDDVSLLRDLGVDAFRFSISWPRVIPDGGGRVNEVGLDFYDRLVDELLEAGIRPFPTLYHWDLPQALEDRGGWPERATAEAFARYADVVARRLGDRVTDWTTHNEPFCASWLGYGLGVHAPGRRSRRLALSAAHNLLLSHGLAVEALRAAAPAAEVGIVLDSWPVQPATDAPEDARAAALLDGTRNRWFFDPLFLGSYPDDMLAHFAGDAPEVRDGDLALVSAPLDFVGVNNYSRHLVRAAQGAEVSVDVRSPDGELTDTGWEVYPAGIRDVLVRLHRDYRVPSLYVTENGAAYADVVTHDRSVHDLERIRYLRAYVAAVADAAAEGAPVRGYFVWSFLDNFEWALGYAKRFGIVYVDYPTLERIPKDSYFWFRDLIARQAGATADASSPHPRPVQARLGG